MKQRVAERPAAPVVGDVNAKHSELQVINHSVLFFLIGSGSEIQFLSEAQDDPQKRKPDIRKAKLLLGWEPVVRTDELLLLCGKTPGIREAEGGPRHNNSFPLPECLPNTISRTVLIF